MGAPKCIWARSPRRSPLTLFPRPRSVSLHPQRSSRFEFTPFWTSHLFGISDFEIWNFGLRTTPPPCTTVRPTRRRRVLQWRIESRVARAVVEVLKRVRPLQVRGPRVGDACYSGTSRAAWRARLHGFSGACARCRCAPHASETRATVAHREPRGARGCTGSQARAPAADARTTRRRRVLQWRIESRVARAVARVLRRVRPLQVRGPRVGDACYSGVRSGCGHAVMR
jgi:hypothetical protein